MAPSAAPAATPRVGIWEDFIDIFYAPSSVFRRRENGNFFIPLAVITIVCGVLFYLNTTRSVFDYFRLVMTFLKL